MRSGHSDDTARHCVDGWRATGEVSDGSKIISSRTSGSTCCQLQMGIKGHCGRSVTDRASSVPNDNPVNAMTCGSLDASVCPRGDLNSEQPHPASSGYVRNRLSCKGFQGSPITPNPATSGGVRLVP